MDGDGLWRRRNASAGRSCRGARAGGRKGKGKKKKATRGEEEVLHGDLGVIPMHSGGGRSWRGLLRPRRSFDPRKKTTGIFLTDRSLGFYK